MQNDFDTLELGKNLKEDTVIMDLVRTEFKKIRIEGKRDFEKQNSEENKTFYVIDKNRSRYDAWRGSRDFRDFKRTESNNWRTHSGNRWRKSQSKSPSATRPRSVSWSRDKSSDFRTLKDFQEQVLKELKCLKENQNKMSKIQDDLLAKVY